MRQRWRAAAARVLLFVVFQAEQRRDAKLHGIERFGADDIARGRGEDDEVAARLPAVNDQRALQGIDDPVVWHSIGVEHLELVDQIALRVGWRE